MSTNEDVQIPAISGERVTFTFNGEMVVANAHQSLAAALWAAGYRQLGTSRSKAEPRGLFCGDGWCGNCFVVVDGRHRVRACSTRVREGMRVEMQLGDPDLG
ncbi:(2Fe-2S)-binding protein [Kyrpidia spormannii]|uniref:Hydrogen cyanide synthase subunit HcnA n=2 Tax=Kyrpidia spormannii TaxID=2055160 RepID=A0ACA8Z748_9BACL|nr:(2Fe-2S)-binding protein [Kyrpidia spormannii]CAB3390719.1 Hydrogen cyanide synthase subunit HcnA [Kyrpidia spormannii]CAB3391632.1 Hydrogen cyanide synthase subunit HcnA [Kyrpidia spormannii]HHY68198.1 (2Fe-2S)-binding protein [Alicyclobacillus sp.]